MWPAVLCTHCKVLDKPQALPCPACLLIANIVPKKISYLFLPVTLPSYFLTSDALQLLPTSVPFTHICSFPSDSSSRPQRTEVNHRVSLPQSLPSIIHLISYHSMHSHDSQTFCIINVQIIPLLCAGVWGSGFSRVWCRLSYSPEGYAFLAQEGFPASRVLSDEIWPSLSIEGGCLCLPTAIGRPVPW